ncbi:MAG: N-acetylmuramic acid 6-phosphate etherase [Sphingobacteriales bacterium]|nr:MAG: N-acetylmuramic acid 6-phosphate etherase [Sphingobacteriales bacterium]
MDEPELSLSLDWQKKILVDVVNSPSCVQLIAITHSPFVFDNELEPYATSLQLNLSRLPKDNNISDKDFVVGIASSGTTPYVIGALEEAKKRGIITGSITNNPGSPLSLIADFPISVEVGPEFVTGSTRMKSGTSQKLILNMISTAVMIQLGRVEDNKMVNMQLTNEKLVDRGTKMIMDKLALDNYDKAKELLLQYGSVKKAVDNFRN